MKCNEIKWYAMIYDDIQWYDNVMIWDEILYVIYEDIW